MTGVAGAHLESVLETETAEHLAANGWLYSPTDAGFDRDLDAVMDQLRAMLVEVAR